MPLRPLNIFAPLCSSHQVSPSVRWCCAQLGPLPAPTSCSLDLNDDTTAAHCSQLSAHGSQVQAMRSGHLLDGCCTEPAILPTTVLKWATRSSHTATNQSVCKFRRLTALTGRFWRGAPFPNPPFPTTNPVDITTPTSSVTNVWCFQSLRLKLKTIIRVAPQLR